MLYVYFILYFLVIRANDQNQTTIQISTKNLFNNGKKMYIALVYRGCWYIAYHKNNATLIRMPLILEKYFENCGPPI